MPLLLKSNRVDYINKESLRRIRRHGGALYLPTKMHGDGVKDIISTAFSLFNNNKDSIKAGTDIASNIAKTVTNTIKDAEDIKSLQLKNKELEDQYLAKLAKRKNKAENHENTVKEGSGFYIVNP